MTLQEQIVEIVRAFPDGLTVHEIAARMRRDVRQIGSHVCKAADRYNIERISMVQKYAGGKRAHRYMIFRARKAA